MITPFPRKYEREATAVVGTSAWVGGWVKRGRMANPRSQNPHCCMRNPGSTDWEDFPLSGGNSPLQNKSLLGPWKTT